MGHRSDRRERGISTGLDLEWCRMQMKRPIFVLALGACALAGCSRKTETVAASDTAFPVKVAKVESRTVPVEIKAVGSVEAYSTISIKSRVTGALDKGYFKEGDAVKE